MWIAMQYRRASPIDRFYNKTERISCLVDAAAASLLSVRSFDDGSASVEGTNFIAPTGHGRLLYV